MEARRKIYIADKEDKVAWDKCVTQHKLYVNRVKLIVMENFFNSVGVPKDVYAATQNIVLADVKNKIYFDGELEKINAQYKKKPQELTREKVVQAF